MSMIQQCKDMSRALVASQESIAAILTSVSDTPDWRPDEEAWSFREIAAHMATVEEECFLVRVQRIVSEETPRFEYYLNTGRDFGEITIDDSINLWQVVREQLLAFIATLAEGQLRRTGLHATFGEFNVLGAMRIMLDHDEEHLADLRHRVALYHAE